MKRISDQSGYALIGMLHYLETLGMAGKGVTHTSQPSHVRFEVHSLVERTLLVPV